MRSKERETLGRRVVQFLAQSRISRGTFAVVFCSLVLWGCMSCLFAQDKLDHGTTNSICYSDSDMQKWMKDNYTGTVTAKSLSSTKISTLNVSQSELTTYYNKVHSSNPITDKGGICWAAAQTSVLKQAGATSSVKSIGRYVIEKAMDKGWVSTSDTGFNFTHADTLMNSMFDKFSMNKKANNDRYDIYNELKNEISKGRAVIFKIKEHEMTGCGYKEYQVNYQSKNILGVWKDKTDTCKFVIVNTTWGTATNNDYAYFPEGEIGANVFTRWDFGITKYENK